MKLDSGDGRKDGDGAYQLASSGENNGVIYTVAGSSGFTKGGKFGHAAHFVSMKELGSVVMDFNGDSVDVRFVSPNPDAIDYYSVTKL